MNVRDPVIRNNCHCRSHDLYCEAATCWRLRDKATGHVTLDAEPRDESRTVWQVPDKPSLSVRYAD